jgi:hypothetical protein
MKTLEQIIGSSKDFPLEITLSSGDRYVLPHPDYLQRHPHKGDYVIYPVKGPFHVIVNAKHIVSLKPVRAKARLRKAS